MLEETTEVLMHQPSPTDSLDSIAVTVTLGIICDGFVTTRMHECTNNCRIDVKFSLEATAMNNVSPWLQDCHGRCTVMETEWSGSSYCYGYWIIMYFHSYWTVKVTVSPSLLLDCQGHCIVMVTGLSQYPSAIFTDLPRSWHYHGYHIAKVY